MPWVGSLAGVIYEVIVVRQLSNRVDIEMVPLIQARRRWKTVYIGFDNEEEEKHRREALSHPRRLLIEGHTKEFYSELNEITPNRLYYPEKWNQIGLDAFILFDGRLYIFQVTVGERHKSTNGLVDFFRGVDGAPPTTSWDFVFLIPGDRVLTCPGVSDEIHLYSAKVSVGEGK